MSIPDSEFIRGKVPMTKEEVRAVSIGKLRLCKNAVLWDIGSGTGSVSVEAALQDSSIKVYSIECNEEAVELTKQNAKKFQADNIHIVQALAPDGLEGIPVATHAFIGGSRGNMESILKKLMQVNPGMRVVINAVCLETIGSVQAALKKLNVVDYELVQLSVSRANEVAGLHMMNASNPVFIFSFAFIGQDGTN